jgi:hypothetical protein
MTPEDERALVDLCGEGAAEFQESGLRVFWLPRVALPAGCSPSPMFGIYVASPLDNYTSRLFLEHPVTMTDGTVPQTAARVLLGRTVHSASINNVPASLSPHKAVLAHLRRYGS